MIGGCINTRQSRRTRFNECYYWKRDESIRDLSEYGHLKQYNGIFYAKEENAKYSQNNVVGGSFMYNSNSVQISTSDDVNIDVNDVVKYQGQFWRVANVQAREIHKQSQFLIEEDKITYLDLKR